MRYLLDRLRLLAQHKSNKCNNICEVHYSMQYWSFFDRELIPRAAAHRYSCYFSSRCYWWGDPL